MYQSMNRMTGFSLVELLVAVLIFAIGLVGLAALQLVGIQSNQTAYHRSIATQLAYDMADRMRSNQAGVIGGGYNQGPSGTDASKCEQVTPSVIPSCTPAELAAYDLKRWNDELAKRLPGGTGIVCLTKDAPETGDSSTPLAACDPTGKVYVVKVWWDDNRSGSTTQGFVTSFQLGGD